MPQTAEEPREQTGAPQGDHHYEGMSSIPDVGPYRQALAYAEMGIYVFPARVKRGKDDKKAVYPVDKWRDASTVSKADISAWWGEGGSHRDASVCIDTGKSELVVVDPDGPEGITNWRALEQPPTMRVGTPGGGEHWYYRAHPRHVVGNDQSGKVATSVDVRGLGGFVIAPPSKDWRGRYEVIEGDLSALTTVPPLVVERMTKGKTATGEPAASDDDLFEGAKNERRFTVEQAEAWIAEYGMPYLDGMKAEDYNERIATYAKVCARFPWLVDREECARRVNEALKPHKRLVTDNDYMKSINGAYSRTEDRGEWVATKVEASGNWRELSGDDWGQVGEATKARALDSLRSKLLTFDQLRDIPRPEPLIKGVLNLDSATWLIGQPGGFKSFVALDWACHVATGRTWHERKVRKGKVLYVVAEGVRGFAKRVEAWTMRLGEKPEELLIYPGAIQASNATEWRSLVELVKEIEPALVVLDTQARMTVGMEENSNTEMGVWVQAVDALKRAAGACILVVHHTGRSGGDARGASALDGAQDAEWKVDRKPHKLDFTLSCDKNKDDDDTARWTFGMEKVVVGVDEDGQDITSLVIGHERTADDRNSAVREIELTKAEGETLSARQIVTRVLDELDTHRDGMTLAAIEQAVAAARKSAKQDPYAKGTVRSTLNKLRDVGTVDLAKSRYVLTFERATGDTHLAATGTRGDTRSDDLPDTQ